MMLWDCRCFAGPTPDTIRIYVASLSRRTWQEQKKLACGVWMAPALEICNFQLTNVEKYGDNARQDDLFCCICPISWFILSIRKLDTNCARLPGFLFKQDPRDGCFNGNFEVRPLQYIRGEVRRLNSYSTTVGINVRH